MRVAIYARVSTSDKDQNPDTQLLPLREFYIAQDWRVVEEFVDTASATNVKGRTAWRSLLTLAAQRRVDTVLVWKLDRAFRSVLHASTTLEDFRRWGVGLRSYTEPWADTTSAQGELVFNQLTTFAQFERSLIRERVIAGMARAKKQGKRLGRRGGTWAEGFEEGWVSLEPRIRAGSISHSEASRQLSISRATILRRLNARLASENNRD